MEERNPFDYKTAAKEKAKEGFSNWLEIIDDPLNMPESLQNKADQIVRYFDSGVVFLINPENILNPRINKLMKLFYTLVGQKITPAAVLEGCTCVAFYGEILKSGQRAFVMIPPNWVEMVTENKWMQSGALVFVASQAVDYYKGKLGKDTVRRAGAYEAEFLRSLTLDPSTKFTPNKYQQHILNEFPLGLESLEPESRYEL